jgi:hypothetical protein
MHKIWLAMVSRGRVAAILSAAAGLLAFSSGPARAITIKPTFDASITSRANAATIETAFDAAAAQIDKDFANPATVNITVSWGTAGGQKLGTGDISGSVDNLSGAYSYSAVVADLTAVSKANPKDTTLATAVAHLPKADPTKKNAFEIPYAEAKAIGLLPASLPIADGYVGFSSGVNFDFNPVGGITAGDYDFEGLATHEIEEVLGRTSGLESANPAWATPFDLFRYAASGASSFSYTAASYFSIDGGKTNLGDFNYSGTGDRGDWLSVGGATDLQDAFLSTGRAYALSASDLTALNTLGWGAWTAPAGSLSPGPSTLSPVGGAQGAVPEPSTWAMMIVGMGLLGAVIRRRGAWDLAPNL